MNMYIVVGVLVELVLCMVLFFLTFKAKQIAKKNNELEPMGTLIVTEVSEDNQCYIHLSINEDNMKKLTSNDKTTVLFNVRKKRVEN